MRFEALPVGKVEITQNWVRVCIYVRLSFTFVNPKWNPWAAMKRSLKRKSRSKRHSWQVPRKTHPIISLAFWVLRVGYGKNHAYPRLICRMEEKKKCALCSKLRDWEGQRKQKPWCCCVSGRQGWQSHRNLSRRVLQTEELQINSCKTPD